MVFSFIHNLRAQDKKAENLFSKGEEAYKSRDYETARVFFEKALERYPDYALAYYRLGQLAYAKRDLSKARQMYETLLHKDSGNKSYVLAFSFLASEYQKEERYEEAIRYYDLALKNTKAGSRAYAQLESQKKESEFAIQAKENPLVIAPQKMDAILNMKDKQYFPAFTADGETIYYTARSNNGDEDIYISNLNDGKWSEPEGISKLINTDYNEGTCTISADGKTMVFTSCEGRPGFGSCDLFISRHSSKGWSSPENMGANVNSPAWDSQASLSPDGTVIIFSSERYGGEGGKDLYVSRLGDMNVWSVAQNLGKKINTSRDEISPYLHPNMTSLFFASNGHMGLGGYDVFLSERVKGQFTKPENLGYPLNDVKDQLALVISADGKRAYYSVESGENVNLYQFDLPQELKEKFNPTFYLKGVIRDAVTKEALTARIQLVNLSTKETISTFEADEKSGEYLAVLPFSGNFGLYVEHPDYFFKSMSFSFNGKERKSNKELNVDLEKIEKEKTEILNNIYFDEGSYELKPESMTELSKLAELIWRNPSLKVEISGHTDDVGNEEANLLLSKKRAEAVVAYLISEGLNEKNLIAKGFGESRPIVKNDSDQNRQLNRRIELKFL